MRNLWRKAVQRAQGIYKRFVANEPANDFEEIAFKSLRLTAKAMAELAYRRVMARVV